jgi:hypothetical protein
MIIIIQNVVLFSIAVLLVIGFYNHGYFYNFDISMMLIVGGIFTYAVIKLIIWSTYNFQAKQSSDGVIIFKENEKNLINHGLKKQLIQPLRKSRMKVGDIYNAKINIMSKNYFANLRITNIFEKKLEKLSLEDIYREGFQSKITFKNQWVQKYGGWDPKQRIRLIRFNIVD